MSTSTIVTTRYAVDARVVSPGVSEARCGDATIRFDTSGGRTSEHFGPADLLATAFAACLLKNVERFSKMLGFEYSDASVHVVAERQEDPPKMTSIRYDVRIATGASEHTIDLLHRNIRKFGTIYNTLAAVCDVSGEIVKTSL